MKCPLCDVDLVMSERQGIEIDYCPQCRGVWLDRGELDKIIDRSAEIQASAPAPAAAPVAPQPRYQDDYRRDGRNDHRGYDKRDYDYDKKHYKKKKRESFLSDLFEFGD